MTPKKEMLTTQQAAEYLGLKVSYLYKLMMNRAIAYYKPNGKVCYFDTDDLDVWKCSNRICTQAELDSQAQFYMVERAIKRGGGRF